MSLLLLLVVVVVVVVSCGTDVTTGTVVGMGNNNFNLREYDMTTGKPTTTYSSFTSAVAAHDYFDEYVVMRSSSQVGMFLVESPSNPIWIISGSFGGDVVFSPDGERVAVGSGYGVSQYDRATGELLARSTGYNPMSIAYHPSQITYAVAETDEFDVNRYGYVSIYDAENGTLLSRVRQHPGGAKGVAVSPDGLTVASGQGTPIGAVEDYNIRLWRYPSLELITKLRHRLGPNGNYHAVTFSPDGAHVAGGAWGALRVWDVNTYGIVYEIVVSDQGYYNDVKGVDYSPDGKYIAYNDVTYNSPILNEAHASNGTRIRQIRETTGLAIYQVKYRP